jgi:Domain of unknown function (DUF5916)/Carbohydrate family 9 binding domain-like
MLAIAATATFTLVLSAAPRNAPSADTTHRAGPAPRSIRAVSVASPPQIDGVLDDSVWAGARGASGFVQAEPREGQPATERTEVRIAYDADNIYIAAYMHDRDPSGLIVNDIRKDFDETGEDDFEVLLDTFDDQRNGYIFITNVAGAKADRQVANEGREVNGSWDAVWRVATRRVADGWTAEIAIPFTAIRFATTGPQRWGINFSRRIRRKNEVDFWAPVPRSYGLTRVSLAGELDGLSTAHASRDLRVKPYVAARTVRETGGRTFDRTGNVGVDLKYGITSHLTLDGTVNPDFAQAEADEQQVNLTQFSQFFPEKREFFLENSGTFYVGDAARNNRVSTPVTSDEDLVLFFSRRIGLTPDGRTIRVPGGLRLTGSAAGLDIGALAMTTAASASTPATSYGVLRLRRNLYEGSDVGVILMNRQSRDSVRSWNRVFGGDANLRFLGALDWNSYVIGTATPGVHGGQYATRSTINYDGDRAHLKAGVMQIGDGFRDDLGYYRRTDDRKWILETGLRSRTRWLDAHGVREMHPHLTWSYYEDLRGNILAKNLHTGYTFFLNDGGYVELSVNPRFERLTAAFTINPTVASLPAGGYAWTEWQLKGQTDPSRTLSLTFSGISGGLWNGHQRTVSGTVTLRPSYRSKLEVGGQRTDARLGVAGPTHFVANLVTFRGNYSFSTTAFLDALSQYDAGSHQLNANLRFNVIHHPLSDVFVVFNEQRFLTPDGRAPGAFATIDPALNSGLPGESLIVKVTQMVAF